MIVYYYQIQCKGFIIQLLQRPLIPVSCNIACYFFKLLKQGCCKYHMH